jgi:hypothetical protein
MSGQRGAYSARTSQSVRNDFWKRQRFGEFFEVFLGFGYLATEYECYFGIPGYLVTSNKKKFWTRKTRKQPKFWVSKNAKPIKIAPYLKSPRLKKTSNEPLRECVDNDGFVVGPCFWCFRWRYNNPLNQHKKFYSILICRIFSMNSTTAFFYLNLYAPTALQSKSATF